MPDQKISQDTVLASPGASTYAAVVDGAANYRLGLDGYRAWLGLATFNVQTASYTFVLADAWREVHMNVASANTLTVPPNASVAFPVGTTLVFGQKGAGTTTLVAGSGVTLRQPASLALRIQWSRGAATQIAANEWWVEGDFA